jgi:hypothetical protein
MNWEEKSVQTEKPSGALIRAEMARRAKVRWQVMRCRRVVSSGWMAARKEALARYRPMCARNDEVWRCWASGRR